jgi:hypothetical protein
MYQIENRKRTIAFAAAAILIVGGIVWGIVALVKNKGGEGDRGNQSQVYEALVAVTDQKSGDPAEDARANLKAGDVISIRPEGREWSETERISYLIIKLKLKKEDADKLTQAQTKEVKEEKGVKGEEKGKEMGPRQETVRARAYRLKIEKLDFDLQKFWENQRQPYPDKIFDKGLIEKKKELK